jgi:death on curing protein
VLFLTLDEALSIARRVVGADVMVRDAGLLEAALARPQATYEGAVVYPDLDDMAAALTESIVTNHALVDGNKRLALACLIVFLRINGQPLRMSNDEAYDLIHDIASGSLRGVDPISRRIKLVNGR